VVTRTVRLLAQLTRQVAVVQYPSLTRAAIRHIELVPLAPRRLLLVVITGNGRVEQRSVDLPEAMADDEIAHLRAVLNAALDGRWLTDVPQIVSGLPEKFAPAARPNAAAVLSVILESLVENHDGKVVFGGAANLAAADLSISLRGVLEALEEQVVLIRLLGEAAEPTSVTVRIGAENPVEGLRFTSVVTTGYSAGDQALARLGVLGPTRMDYPGAMGAVRAVARYVSHILAGS
jgi:heat-inducible transcriptional repressor